MDLMFRQSIRQGKALPDPYLSDVHRVMLRLPGEVGDPRFLRFLEQVGDEQLKSFSTDDFLVIDPFIVNMDCPTISRTARRRWWPLA
jgi:ATP-dependent DNA helicase RecG